MGNPIIQLTQALSTTQVVEQVSSGKKKGHRTSGPGDHFGGTRRRHLESLKGDAEALEEISVQRYAQALYVDAWKLWRETYGSTHM